MRFRVLPEAQLEAVEAAIWYDDHQQLLGSEFLEEVAAAFDRIRISPDSNSKLETYLGSHDIRRALLRRFPYAVIILRREMEVIIVAVAHTSRRPLYWLERLE